MVYIACILVGLVLGFVVGAVAHLASIKAQVEKNGLLLLKNRLYKVTLVEKGEIHVSTDNHKRS